MNLKTRNKTGKDSWEQEFDRIFDPIYLEAEASVVEHLDVALKSFISTQIEQARKEERKRIVEEIRGMREPDTVWIGHPHGCDYCTAIDDILERIEEKEEVGK